MVVWLIDHLYKHIHITFLICYIPVPTPPGSIIINQKTNASLHMAWATPALMDGAPAISYHITYQHEAGGPRSKNSIANNTVLDSLFSGTFYNITVETVGPQNLRSTIIHNSTFTSKYNCEKLKKKREACLFFTPWSDEINTSPYLSFF